MRCLYRCGAVPPGFRPRGLLPAIVLILGLLAEPVASAGLMAQQQEEAEPLRKNEVVNLLTSGLYTRPEIERAIRVRCVAFQPTDRDLADFRELGAGESIIGAIRDCLEARRASRPVSQAPPPPLRLSTPDSALVLAAGDTATVSARLTRGAAPARGVRVVLRDGSGLVVGREDTLLEALSDSTGRVAFRISAPERVGRTPLVLGTDQDSVRVDLRVRPADPARVDVEPRTLRWKEPSDSLGVSLRVTDRFGNPVPSIPVLLTASLRGELTRKTTGAEGEAMLRVSGEELRGLDSLRLRADGRELASLSVVRETAEPAGEAADRGAETEPSEPADSLGELRSLTSAAERSRASGNAEEAVSLLRRATELAPDSAELWAELAAAERRGGDDRAAEEALRKARELAPHREEFRERLQALLADRAAVWSRLSAWGGDTFGTSSSTPSSGFHRGVLEFWPLPGALGLFAEYDRGVEPERSELVRGPAGYESVYGGMLLEWGASRNFSTRLEGGSRQRPPSEVEQRIYRLRQTIRFGDGTRRDFERLALRVAGGLGVWQDSEDRDGFARLGLDLPIGRTVRISSDLIVTDAIGTWPSTVDRLGVQEVRLQLAPAYRSPGGFEVGAGVGVGRVETPRSRSRSKATLFDSFVRTSVPLGRAVHLELFYRHQVPELHQSLDFQVLSAGLSATIPR